MSYLMYKKIGMFERVIYEYVTKTIRPRQDFDEVNLQGMCSESSTRHEHSLCVYYVLVLWYRITTVILSRVELFQQWEIVISPYANVIFLFVRK